MPLCDDFEVGLAFEPEGPAILDRGIAGCFGEVAEEDGWDVFLGVFLPLAPGPCVISDGFCD